MGGGGGGVFVCLCFLCKELLNVRVLFWHKYICNRVKKASSQELQDRIMDSESYGEQKYFLLFALDLHADITTSDIKEWLYIQS